MEACFSYKDNHLPLFLFLLDSKIRCQIFTSVFKYLEGQLGGFFCLAVFDSLSVIIALCRKQDASSILVEISEKSVYPAPSNK